MTSSSICDLEESCLNHCLKFLVFSVIFFIWNFTICFVDDRYTHQCIHEIVMLGPAAPLLAVRMIGVEVFIRKQRPNSYLVFCVILAIPGWLSTRPPTRVLWLVKIWCPGAPWPIRELFSYSRVAQTLWSVGRLGKSIVFSFEVQDRSRCFTSKANSFFTK